jgi:NAD(P)-dependent dehydrogenase (short-subunit alcohol dehydrogenase family)
MTRTYAVTGSASGIGLATKQLLEEQGHRVVGIDLRTADVEADLSSADGRANLAERVAAASGGSLDAVIAVIAVAGVALPSSLTVRVNYFGAKATLEALQPRLTSSPAPRAVVVASFSTLQENDTQLVDELRRGDEPASVARADELAADNRGDLIYASTKRAIAEWVREASISKEWAGAGIPLNAVGPGVVLSPMTAPMLETEEGRAALMSVVPMPLHGPSEAVVVARLLAWLASEENTHVTGQVVFVDGGADVSLRGPRIFGLG